MNRLNVKPLLVMVMCVWPFVSYAQSACDKLFSSGVKLQQTMTVGSQKKAISYFEKAKICYDSQAKKELCDQQIKACRNIIVQISKSNNQKKNPSSDIIGGKKVKSDSVRVEVEVKKNVELSINCTYLKFKGKGGEFKKAKVTCNYPDWKVVDMPSWVNCSRNENDEIVVEVEKNLSKEERSGILKIECGDESVTLTIIQERQKMFGIL